MNRVQWAVDTLDPGPDDQLLEIGCGPGVAVSLVCGRLVSGRIVAIDRSATAIERARRRNAEHVAAGRAVLWVADLERLAPADLLRGAERFDKVFAMNVNLFWVRPPRRELDLVRRLLRPGGALYLFYGYGRPQPGRAGDNAGRVRGVLTCHLTEAGFAVEVRTAGSELGVIATPET